MRRPTLTRELAFASGQTVVDMRLQQRASGSAWTREDADAAGARTNALLLHVPRSQGGLQGLSFTHTMIEDLGVTAEQVRASGNQIVGDNERAA